MADQAFEKIVSAIVTGDLPPGSRISEPGLARALGISRGPLREAIRRLEGGKLVTRTPHVGARVVSLAPQELVEVYFVREALEGMACRLATERMSDDELDHLEAKLNQHARFLEQADGMAYFQQSADQDFHFLIARGSRNQRLSELLCGELYYLVRIYRYRTSVQPGRAREALGEHRRILEAMRRRDTGRAEELMREHIAIARGKVTTEKTPAQHDAA
ncbi:MAG: GntR family transcriptional regulator [Alphaproteobacteria bacterium]|nr:GntR family transcriptional regulator [Alphaproteobacteria bacterium]